MVAVFKIFSKKYFVPMIHGQKGETLALTTVFFLSQVRINVRNFLVYLSFQCELNKSSSGDYLCLELLFLKIFNVFFYLMDIFLMLYCKFFL